jgi:hypothetical protein
VAIKQECRQKKVLRLLQQVGPTNYNVLLVQFDFHNGYLQGAVGKLLCDKHIKLDRTKNMVHITEAGYGLLQEMGYWSELSSSHGGSPLYWLSLQVASVMNQDLASVRKAEG